MNIANEMLSKLGSDITNLKEGLDPENLAFWYNKIIAETIDMAPPWLHLMIAIDNNLDAMPYSTRLYFLKVQEIMSTEMDKSLI
ncbi:MAG: hypothetical protein HYS75_05210 [Nitrosopumilales archaeon]|nr:hypothetical protein [Nitrosopumilales archaeon]